jgi:hypothetical protein
MAQSGYTPIITYYSTTAAAVPLAANLAPGELSLNISDMKLYCENSAGVVTLLASAAASGSVTSVAATVPSIFSIAGSPITTSGTLAMTYSGTALPVANGGTGATTLTANYVLLGNGTSAPQMIAPSSSGNVLTSNGTTWASTAPAASGATKGQAIAFSIVFGL